MSNQKPKVVVCGAGIGGLTVAHELAKQNFEVVIYERHDIVGGLARSTYYTDPTTQFKYPIEYSWRVYGAGYKNLLRVLSEIPLREQSSKSVFNNLINICTYIFPRFGQKQSVIQRSQRKIDLTNNFEKHDFRRMVDKMLYCMTMSKERMDSLDSLTWAKFCEGLSPEANKYMVTMWGPVVGMDPTYMSFPVVARMIQILMSGVLSDVSSLYLMNKPTNDGWFDEWVADLKNKNVAIKTGFEIADFQLENGKIKSVLIKDKATSQTFEDSADYFVCSLSVEAIAGIVAQNNELAKSESLKNTIKLAEKCRQIQLSVQIFLDKKIDYKTEDLNVSYLPDTPWAIIIEPQDEIWGATYSTNPAVKTVLSAGICQTDVPGIFHKKPFTACTEKEVEEEVWAQILASYKNSSITTEDGAPLDQAKIVLFYMWDSFKFNPEKKQIEVWEPKFSNNAGSLQYQPTPVTEIPNFLFATAYTKTDRFIYSMEAAAEAGTIAANHIINNALLQTSPQQSNATKQTNSTNHPITPSAKTAPIYPFSTTVKALKPLLFIDRLLFKLGLPHPSRLFFGSSIALVLVYAAIVVALVVWVVVKLVGLVF